MKRVFYSQYFLKHDLEGHPENAQRLINFMEGVASERVTIIEPKPASDEFLLKAHTKMHVERVKKACESDYFPVYLDPDTYVVKDSYKAAALACGALEQAVEISLREKVNILCAVRPPGHHATRDSSMGFCIFNNVAVGAYKALSLNKRPFIVDFDAHHGNGTQEIFYTEPNVFYFSSHQFPFYPGTGSPSENNNHIQNFPLSAGAGDAEFEVIYAQRLPCFIEAFEPDILIVSSGFDIHENDPITSLFVTDRGLANIIESIAKAASDAKIPVVYALEGGYDPHALRLGGRLLAQVL